MKNKKIIFFLVGSLLLLILFTFSLLKLYDHYIYQALNQMVYSLEEEYPDIDIRLVAALTHQEEANDILGKYGIDIDTINEIASYHDFKIQVLCLVLFTFFGIIFLFVLIYLIDRKKIKKEIRIINQYLQDILNNQYELNIALYQEDELSILKNDIYKVTLKLKNLSSYEQKEQKFLMNTLEDISHQLKTPLTALMITNDILVNNDLTEEERIQFLKKETKELEKMEWLITTLLKLSKLDSRQVKFKMDKIEAEDLIDQALESLLVLLELKHITITKKNLDFHLFCDVAWMREALTNILKNACEHTLENGRISITGDDNPVYQAIFITDYGQGISKNEIKNIFKRFYSTNSSKNSMGIGLNMARIIVEKHHGKIEVDSVVGKYTTFKVIFMKTNC